MKPVRVIGIFAALALPLALGCGGGGSSAVTDSVYAGTYTGPWSDATLAQTGTLTLTIASNGTVSGSLVNSTTGATGVESGSVSNVGNTIITTSYPSSTVTDKGTVAFIAGGNLSGNFIEYNGTTQIGTATFSLVP